MAKSTAVVKTADVSDAPLTSKVSSGSPYQLDPAQVERAATALVAHMKKHAQQKAEMVKTKNLAADEDEPDVSDATLYLTMSTKKHINDGNRLKPKKIRLPHPFQSDAVRICLITVDPQRKYKDLVADPGFPEELRNKIGRVLGIEKLRRKYKTFETKRQLLAEYDVFLADDRIINTLPNVLGKVFYSSKGKRPVPVVLTAGADKPEKQEKKPMAKKDVNSNTIGTPKAVAQEVETALNSTLVNLSASANTAIKIGKQSMTSQQIRENVEAVVSVLTDRFVPQGWRNIRGLHIKGPTTQALPVWLADELWTDEQQVLDEPWKPAIKEGDSYNKKTKRRWDEWEEELLDEDELAERRAHLKKSKKARKEKPAKEAGAISREDRRKLKRQALESVQTSLIAG